MNVMHFNRVNFSTENNERTRSTARAHWALQYDIPGLSLNKISLLLVLNRVWLLGHVGIVEGRGGGRGGPRVTLGGGVTPLGGHVGIHVVHRSLHSHSVWGHTHARHTRLRHSWHASWRHTRHTRWRHTRHTSWRHSGHTRRRNSRHASWWHSLHNGHSRHPSLRHTSRHSHRLHALRHRHTARRHAHRRHTSHCLHLRHESWVHAGHAVGLVGHTGGLCHECVVEGQRLNQLTAQTSQPIIYYRRH